MTVAHGVSAEHENWDDAFEFHENLQVSSGPSLLTRDSALMEDWDQELRPETTSHAGPSKFTHTERKMSLESENWDADFIDDRPDQPQHSDWASDAVHSKNPSDEDHATYNTDEDDEDDDIDLGFADKEEDRTVTARSRRAALSRLNSPPNATPPPPVPPIPFSLVSERPFPRSPTASVFSVPTLNSGRDSYYHNSSTTHLRPTVSRTSMGGFANLPPSPPIHKERERRRLRKKSRPPEAVYELVVRNPLPPPSLNSSSDVLERPDQSARTRSPTPQTPPSTPPLFDPLSTSANSSNRNSINASLGAPSPPNKTPLLSRIGSVKKWGVRKKRASSTPAEVMLQEAGQDQGTPRPHAGPSSSSPSKSGWFFRATSGSHQSDSTPHQLAGRHDQAHPTNGTQSSTDLNPGHQTTFQELPSDTPSKLVKRRSFGFVPIRRNKGPFNDVVVATGLQNDLPADLEAQLALSESSKKQRPFSQQPSTTQSRYASYGGLGLGRAGGQRITGSTDDLTEQMSRRGRRRSSSRSRSKGPQGDDNEASKSFMDNVRKISFVGRHKRTKSGASLASVGEALRRVSQEAGIDTELQHITDLSSLNRRSIPPPIELHPPSPARVGHNPTIGTQNTNEQVDLFLSTITGTPTSTRKTPSPTSKVTTSPQSASLGRSAVAPATTSNSMSNTVPRRNSLGDLKIPARISQAQVGLRRDLGMVREFAANVEQLKDLQTVYHSVVTEVQGILDNYAHNAPQASARSVSPGFLNLKPGRSRSNTGPATDSSQSQDAYKRLASAFYTINSKYRIAWECAQLLIELGGGSADTTPTSAPSTSVSAPTISVSSSVDAKRGRAITLSGDESKPSNPALVISPNTGSNSVPASPPSEVSPPKLSWRASTGRHDLNQRQLILLREMLNNPDSSFVVEESNIPIPEEAAQSTISVNREWRWGDPMSSTVTLPSEESSVQGGGTSATKKRSSRLGMSGLRDMLRSLARNQGSNPPMPVSSTSLSTNSSLDHQNHHYPHPQVATHGRRRAKTSSGPESGNSTRDRPTSPYNASSLSGPKASPRRPSLASIFRIGQKSKVTPASSTWNSSGDSSAAHVGAGHERVSSGQESSSTGEDEDWDRLDAAGDMEAVTTRDGHATVRGRSPYIHEKSLPSSQSVGPARRSASASQTSLRDPLSPGSRPTRLSNVEEHTDDHLTAKVSSKRAAGASPSRHKTKNRAMVKSGSVRSMPPQPLPDVKLAMTPENIKPLLENSKEVQARLTECIEEIRALVRLHA